MEIGYAINVEVESLKKKTIPATLCLFTSNSGGIQLTIHGKNLEGVGHNVSIVLVDPNNNNDLTVMFERRQK